MKIKNVHIKIKTDDALKRRDFIKINGFLRTALNFYKILRKRVI